MTDTATPVLTGGEAQPMADANAIDSIINNAETEATENPQKPESAEPNEADDKDEVVFPKKAVNAISRRDKQIGKLRAELAAERTAKLALEQQHVKPQQPNQPSAKPADGRPKETDYQTYAAFMEADNDWKIEQKFSKLQETQKQTQQQSNESARYQAWENERLTAVDARADVFAKEYPDVTQLFNDNAELIKSYPPEIKRAFLEAEKPEVAFYNLAKEGKLVDLADMSLVDAKVEIRLAQMQAPKKPQTKAPTPLPASRGSVPSGKSLDAMSGDELLKWVRS